jgi:hypothetical protein
MFVLVLVLAILWQPGEAAVEEKYVGALVCAPCHEVEFRNWSETRHSAAFRTLENAGEQDNPGCWQCHTVGYMQEGGFLSPGLTPHLVNVQCENCHGPGGKHVRDRAPMPPGTLAVCTSCHTPNIDPDFDPQREWGKTRH